MILLIVVTIIIILIIINRINKKVVFLRNKQTVKDFDLTGSKSN